LGSGGEPQRTQRATEGGEVGMGAEVDVEQGGRRLFWVWPFVGSGSVCDSGLKGQLQGIAGGAQFGILARSEIGLTGLGRSC
jgi:hypothetical protein